MTRDELFGALCGKFGWEATPWRLAVFESWAQQEGMPFERTFNPLATTRLSANTHLNTSYDEGFGPGNWNSVPVRVYATAADGITATFETLSLDFYPNIRRCFADQRGYVEAVSEFTTYVGSQSYGQRVVEFMNTTTAGKGGPDAMALVRDVVKATYGSEERMRTLLANNAPLEQRMSHMESGEGPIGTLAEKVGELANHVATLPGLDPALLAALAELGEAARNALGKQPR
jgi:hypothetical protein